MAITVRKAKEKDIESIAVIYRSRFPSEQNHRVWVTCCNRAFPAKVYYVAEEDNVITAYILWGFKNGFRDQSIIELEQIAVEVGYSGRGIGRTLISKSYDYFKKYIESLGFNIGAVYVTTSEGNFAQQLYEEVLGVEEVSLIEGYGAGNEVVLYRNM